MKQHYVERDIGEILLSEEEIKARVAELGRQISRDYEGKEVVAVCILRGCFIFFSDLMRQISIPVAIEFMSVSSYGGGAQSSGSVKINYDMQNDIAGKHVLIVEDIIDSGNTLSHLTEMLRSRDPASIEICALLNKPDRRVVDVPVKYVGFDIPDEFVVGYGLDYNSLYRNYRNIGILKREVYEKE
ncbi:MAG: hypoxanthine phosphoribosyltransferase [Clostridia bacterium]|nr:hypoxanthine phosphoribosyltransferase [Clostridia bacterium]